MTEDTTTWRAKLRRQSVSMGEAMTQLGNISADAVNELVARKEVLAFDDGGKRWFPAWQFDGSATNRVVHGLAVVLSSMSAPPIMIAAWMTHTNAALEATPLAALMAGRVDEVAAEAASVGMT